MTVKKFLFWFFLLLFQTLFLTACEGQVQERIVDEASETAEPATRQTQKVEAGEQGSDSEAADVEETLKNTPELSARTEFAGFGYSIAHPAGWLVATDGPVTAINELAEDHENALQDNSAAAKGYGIIFDHRGMPFLKSIGLPDEPTLQDLFAMNASFFEWPEDLAVTEIEVFDVPALAVQVPQEEDWVYQVMGFLGEQAFLLALTAPDKEALDAFLPTWQRMLESIEPSAGS